MVEQRGGFDRPVAESKDLLDALINMKQDAAKENEGRYQQQATFICCNSTGPMHRRGQRALGVK